MAVIADFDVIAVHPQQDRKTVGGVAIVVDDQYSHEFGSPKCRKRASDKGGIACLD
jgi:hypothetical protein